MQKGMDTSSSSSPANSAHPIGSETADSNQTAHNFPESEKAEDSPPPPPPPCEFSKSGSGREAVDDHSVNNRRLVSCKSNGTSSVEESGRERLKRHRVEMAGRVWIPDMWAHEDFLKDWVDCTAQFDASLVNSTIMSARDSLVEEARRANSTRFRIQNGC